MSVTACIVHYRTGYLLEPLIENLLQQRSVTEVVLIDNSPEEPPPSNLAASPALRLLEPGRNLGFGPAVNLAATQAKNRWLLAVNPDVRLLPECSDRLLAVASEHGLPLVGPRFYWDDALSFKLPPATGSCLWQDNAHRLAELHWLESTTFSAAWIGRHERFWSARQPFNEPFLSGACFLIDTSFFDPGGRIFDERFFLYFEDSDLCVRTLLAGSTPVCAPAAEAVHYWNQSPHAGKPELFGDSARKFMAKHYPGYEPDHRLWRDVPRQAPKAEDLGACSESPVFACPGTVARGDLFFEFGVNASLVPFAQTALNRPWYRFPDSIWSRLMPGRYFGRFRSSLTGSLQVWTWTKS
jgi:GT2 family glycosyltransferase